MKQRTLVLGDLHGNYLALKQCLERCNFSYENDLLITLGDIVDGWSDVYNCVEELLKIKNRIDIRGNHDDWFNDWLMYGLHPTKWSQGADATAISYLRLTDREHLLIPGYGNALNPDDIPPSHKQFFKNQIAYYTISTEENKFCFVHGGFDRNYNIEYQHPNVLMWDRDMWLQALSCAPGKKLKNVDDFNSIFIGHTHVDNWHNPQALPITEGGVTNLDTGAGWSGKLTIMDATSREYWQSDFVKTLYPDESGRRK